MGYVTPRRVWNACNEGNMRAVQVPVLFALGRASPDPRFALTVTPAPAHATVASPQSTGAVVSSPLEQRMQDLRMLGVLAYKMYLGANREVIVQGHGLPPSWSEMVRCTLHATAFASAFCLL